MNVVIIGGAGFLGNNLVRRCLLEPDCKITVVDSLEPCLQTDLDHLRPLFDRIQFVQMDMRHAETMAPFIASADIIFNCAGQTSHPLSIRDPLFDVDINCHGNLRLLEVIKQENPDAVVVYPSSTSVFGTSSEKVLTEDHKLAPRDIYSTNKLAAENYYLIYNIVHDLKVVVLRFANLYGPYGKGHSDFGFVNYFIHLAWSNQAIPIFGSGAQIRNVMFAEDAADIMFRCAQKPELYGKAWLACHEEHYSVLEIAEIIVQELGRGIVDHVDWPDLRRRIEINNAVISSARLYELAGWKPKFNLREGLQATRKILKCNELEL